MTIIDESLVVRLVSDQFPQWAHLPVRRVANDGHDNSTFHLGEEMSVRLPTGAFHAGQVRKEQAWLPRLAQVLPLPIPEPLAEGAPSENYPWPWSVNRWLEGEVLVMETLQDPVAFASDLAGFLKVLRSVGVEKAPRAGMHNFFRGGWLHTYDGETRDAIEVLQREIDAPLLSSIWDEALASSWRLPPVWVHGDVAPGNLLVRNGRLSAVIDFGCAAVGDPACDLAIAWTDLRGPARQAFREGLGLDADTWRRGRGWALWKALIQIRGQRKSDPAMADRSRSVLREIVSEFAG